MKLGRDPKDRAYLHHQDKPLVAVWGIGFNDDRQYTLDECAQLVDFLANDATYGGNAVMIGVPAYWRTLSRDCVDDSKLHSIVRSANIISPWSVGRFNSSESIEHFAQTVWKPDIEWCRKNGLEYLPVVFPGFSWHNMKPGAPLDEIPRQRGCFLWKQFVELRKAGVTMVYQAMFDEVDEGTAVFKCRNDPPIGASTFLDLEKMPSDYYLRLVGMGGRLIRKEIEPGVHLPQ
jgi:hypothetical protein